MAGSRVESRPARGCPRSPRRAQPAHEGRAGALVMGVRHGAYCVACCWALMALLFVAGVMNLWWVAALAVFVLAERVLPGGQAVSRIGGALLLLAGAVILVRG